MSSLIQESALREQLLLESAEYRKLEAEHQMYDHKLEHLSGKHFLSEEEKLQEKTMKKKKLALKDQMHSMIQKYCRQDEQDDLNKNLF
jgi:uncharacterized protein YdcH (DUF465 family)